MKSLNKLESTLQEHMQWIDQIEKLARQAGRKWSQRFQTFLEELTEDLKAASEKADEQIKLLKEAEKARSSRRR